MYILTAGIWVYSWLPFFRFGCIYLSHRLNDALHVAMHQYWQHKVLMNFNGGSEYFDSYLLILLLSVVCCNTPGGMLHRFLAVFGGGSLTGVHWISFHLKARLLALLFPSFSAV